MNLLKQISCLGLALVAALLFGAVGATAQTIPGQSSVPAATVEIAPPSPNDMKELLRLLGDERVVNQLRKNAEEAREADTDTDGEPVTTFRQQIVEGLERTRKRGQLLRAVWTNLSAAPAILAERWREELTDSDAVRSLTYVVIFLFIGAGLEWLFRQYTADRLLRIELARPTTLWTRFGSAIARALLIGSGLVVFAIGSIGAFLSFEWKPFVEIIVVNLLIAVLAIRVVSTMSMFVLAPRVSELRLAPFDNATAKKIHFGLVLVLSLCTIALTISDTFARLAGTGSRSDLVDAASFSVSILAGLICTAAVLIAVWVLSKDRTSGNQPDNDVAETPVGRSAFWRNYLSVLFILAFILWLIAAQDIMWTVLIVGMLPLVRLLMFGWIGHFFDQAEMFDDGNAPEENRQGELAETMEPAVETDQDLDVVAEDRDYRGRYDTYRPIVQRFVRFLIIVLAVLLLLAAWGTDPFTLSDSPTLSGRISSVAIDLVVAYLIADLIWIWAKTAIDHRLADYKPPEGPQAPGPEARMATLLPLLRMILLITLIVMVGLSALSSMGVNIAPLLAGAGVVGVAIGFGAQALVRDVVSGIFFLIDDAFRVGEYVEIGDLRGTVESMSIRSLRVRHHRGAVHTIPFGELSSLTNYSRDWVIMKMDFRVPFETDLKLVKKIVKRIGAEMLEDPLYKDGFLQQLKSQGVRRMEEFNMVVGVKFMAKPGEQWIIRRDAYQKIVDAFEANGIQLAERNVKVEVITDRPLSDEEQEAVIGAAQDAIEQPAGPPVPVKDEP